MNAFPKRVANALGCRQENPGTKSIGERRGERGRSRVTSFKGAIDGNP